MIPNQLKMTVGLGLKHQTPKFQPSHFSVPARMSECKVLNSTPHLASVATATALALLAVLTL